jgi:hypothetical protein
MTLCQRATRDNGQLNNAFYIRYLSFLEPLRNKKLAKNRLVPNGNLMIHPRSFIKQQIFGLFAHPEVLAPPLPNTKRAIGYAYVESENQRSLQICSAFGFQKVRSFRTLPFSRFFPKKDSGLSKIKPEEQEEALQAVSRYYEDHNLFFPDHLFHGDHYYVLKRGGKMVAGLRVMPVNWVINHLPGFSGKLTLHLVPHLPLLSRLFNPQDFKFAAFEGLFSLPGHEAEVFTLMESVLADLKLHTGMLWLDDESEMYRFFLNSGQLGLLHQLEKPSPVNILIRFGESESETVADYQNAPAYISALDMT